MRGILIHSTYEDHDGHRCISTISNFVPACYKNSISLIWQQVVAKLQTSEPAGHLPTCSTNRINGQLLKCRRISVRSMKRFIKKAERFILGTTNPLTFGTSAEISGSAYLVVNLDKMLNSEIYPIMLSLSSLCLEALFNTHSLLVLA